MKKILLITNIPTPYRIPLFNELHQRLQQSSIHLKIIFSVQNYARRKWQLDEQDFLFPYDFLNKTKLVNSRENTRFRYPGLLQKLRKERPDLIIVAGFSAATMVSWIYSRITGIPYVIWSGEIAVRGDRVSWLRSVQRKWLTRAATHCIAYGSQASKYLQQLGASPTHISIALNTVDTTFFMEKVGQIQRKIKPSEKKHLLIVSYITHRKNLTSVLQIIAQLAQQRSDFILDIVGDGPDRAGMESMAAENGLQSCVAFHGYKQQEELPEFYAQASLFLFPTDFDIWGLVLVEAMAAGLPCIASMHAGATDDLIIETKTGFSVDFSQAEMVSDLISKLLDNPSTAAKIGAQAKKYVLANASMSNSADGFMECIHKAMQE